MPILTTTEEDKRELLAMRQNMIKLSEHLEDILLSQVGENIGAYCECYSCEENRERVREAIRTEIERHLQEVQND